MRIGDDTYEPYTCDRCGKNVEGLMPEDFMEHIEITYCRMKYTISFKLCRECSIELNKRVHDFIREPLEKEMEGKDNG